MITLADLGKDSTDGVDDALTRQRPPLHAPTSAFTWNFIGQVVTGSNKLLDVGEILTPKLHANQGKRSPLAVEVSHPQQAVNHFSEPKEMRQRRSFSCLQPFDCPIGTKQEPPSPVSEECVNDRRETTKTSPTHSLIPSWSLEAYVRGIASCWPMRLLVIDTVESSLARRNLSSCDLKAKSRKSRVDTLLSA